MGTATSSPSPTATTNSYVRTSSNNRPYLYVDEEDEDGHYLDYIDSDSYTVPSQTDRTNLSTTLSPRSTVNSTYSSSASRATTPATILLRSTANSISQPRGYTYNTCVPPRSTSSSLVMTSTPITAYHQPDQGGSVTYSNSAYSTLTSSTITTHNSQPVTVSSTISVTTMAPTPTVTNLQPARTHPLTNTTTQSATVTSNSRPITVSSTTMTTLSSAGNTRKPLTSSFSKEISPFKKGDRVAFIAFKIDDLKLSTSSVKRNFKPRYVHKTGIINEIKEGNEISVNFDKSQITWKFDPETSVHRVGDTVQLIAMETQLSELQRGHGEFVPDMKNYFGKKGLIMKIYSDGDLSVAFDGGTWILNPRCVTNLTDKSRFKPPPRKSHLLNIKTLDLPPNKPIKTSRFSIGDRVKVKAIGFKSFKNFQKKHGGWNPRMAQTINKTGIVTGVTDNLDVTVLFDRTRVTWTLAPQVLNKHFMGDIIKISKDKNKVKEFLANNSKYSPKIMEILGESGVVTDVDNDGDLIMIHGDETWILNPSLVTNLTELAKAKSKPKTLEKKQDEGLTLQKWIGQLAEDKSKWSPKTNNGTVKTAKDTNISALLEKNVTLEKKILKMEEMISCGICLDSPKNVIFLCGHGACSTCSRNLDYCHMCRRFLSTRIPIY